MKVLYVFDEDDKYGAPKTGMEMIYELKSNFGITPIVLTSRKNKVNEWCDNNNIENYVTYHHKFTFVKSKSKVKYWLKLIPRFFRYEIGKILACQIVKHKLDFKEISLIHTNNSGLDLGIILSKKYNIPNVMHIREFGELDFEMRSYRRNYIKYLNDGVTKFIAISNAIKDNWIQKGIDSNKISTIYNGVNKEGISRKSNFDNGEFFKIILLGSISSGKGQIELVNAVNILKKDVKEKLQVDIIGSGYKENENLLEREIDKFKLGNIVHFKKYDSNIKEKLKDYDIGVICSKAEGFGRVTVEYMIAGIGIIASNTGANVELINDRETGILYTKGNIKDLADKIEYMYYNKEKIREMASKAYNRMLQMYTVEIFSKNIYQFYKKNFN